MHPKNIAVIGSGTMGNGIAHVFAHKGFQVALVDVSAHALEKAMQQIATNFDRMIKKETATQEEKDSGLSRIHCFQDLQQGVSQADLVVEAASEREEIKMAIFRDLDAICKPETILATNTSSISITKIASATTRPHKVIGMHFMNPVPVMQLVEVVKGYLTDEHTTEQVLSLSRFIGKTPVPANDYPGFVANRILMPMINEAILSLQHGVAGVAEIDAIMKLGMAHPMGPLQLADFIGLDVCLSIMRVLQEGFGDAKYAPAPLLVNMVQAGCLGAKSGVGFYDWRSGGKDLQVAARFR